MNNVHFIILIVFLVICDIVALNFEILHSLDWLQHRHEINAVVRAAGNFSLTILCIFVVEITLRFARHPSRFLKKKFNIADMGVVYISLIIEIVMKVEEKKAKKIFGQFARCDRKQLYIYIYMDIYRPYKIFFWYKIEKNF